MRWVVLSLLLWGGIQSGCNAVNQCPDRQPTTIEGVVRTAIDNVAVVDRSLRVQLRDGATLPADVIAESTSDMTSGEFAIHVPSGSQSCQLFLTTMPNDGNAEYLKTTFPFPTSDGSAIIDAYATPASQAQSWSDKINLGAYLIRFYGGLAPPTNRYVEDGSTPAPGVAVTGDGRIERATYLLDGGVADASLSTTGPLGAAVVAYSDLAYDPMTPGPPDFLPLSGKKDSVRFEGVHVVVPANEIMLLTLHECSATDNFMRCER